MSDKITDFFSNPTTWFGLVFTTVVAWITGAVRYAKGKRDRQADLTKKEIDVKAAELEFHEKEDEYKNKKWKSMEEKNRQLNIELEEAYKTIAQIRKQLDVMENTIKKLTLRVQEQQVKINLNRTIKN